MVHNIRHPISGDRHPHIVTRIPSYGEDRVYAKEQALIDLLTDELAAERPCVVYLRQTATRDIQPRIEGLIRQHVPGAQPFILKNTVQAERREKVIEQQVASGVNVILCNPELTKTGLDLLFAPTIVYYEIVFNLSTMMQAAARSYRLNQTHEQCKVVYLYYESTMEQTAVQLMSRKQRAARLLTGEVGLTGLEALTEGEGGLEQALLDAIAKDAALLDPRELFKTSAAPGEIDAEDAAFWNVEVAAEAVAKAGTEEVEPVHADPVIQTAVELGGDLLASISSYLRTVHIVADAGHLAKLQARLLVVLESGVQNDDATRTVIGLGDADWLPDHGAKLVTWVRGWLKRERVVFSGCEDEVAGEIVRRARIALEVAPVRVVPREAAPKSIRTIPLPQRQPVDGTEPVQLALF